MKYYITDVFAIGKYTGNQLATFIVDKALDTEIMQKIAQEINYSETTFITSGLQKNKGYDVRIYTPKAEIDFAGHPTLGTAFIIKKYLAAKNKRIIKLNLKVGQISVEIKNEMYWMKQVQPEFSEPMDPEYIANMLNLSVSDIDDEFPIMGVTTGLPFTIIPLKSKAALVKSKLNMEVYDEFIQTNWAKGIMIFCRGGYTAIQDLCTRVFVPWLGIPEDPATGSAAGCLSAWLLKNNFYGTTFVNIGIGQGYEINRPSDINIQASIEKGIYNLDVGGEVELIATGDWEE